MRKKSVESNTVGTKINPSLEIIRVKKLMPNAALGKNIYQVMIFGFYTVYKKNEMVKIGNQTIEKSQKLSQMLKLFCLLYYNLCTLVSPKGISKFYTFLNFNAKIK